MNAITAISIKLPTLAQGHGGGVGRRIVLELLADEGGRVEVV